MLPVVAGVSSNDAAVTLRLAKLAAGQGAAALMVAGHAADWRAGMEEAAEAVAAAIRADKLVYLTDSKGVTDQSGELLDAMTADEAYFIWWGWLPDWGFYDHPPMIGWWLAAPTSLPPPTTSAASCSSPPPAVALLSTARAARTSILGLPAGSFS